MISFWRAISASMPRSRNRNEFMFFSSVFTPSVCDPTGRTDTLASARMEPSSMLTSLTPRNSSVWRSWRRNVAASDAERRSGSVTISTSGVPPRLKSTTESVAPARRPPAWVSLAASSSRCARVIPTTSSEPSSRMAVNWPRPQMGMSN